MTARQFHPGMGQAVAERTILRKDKNGKFEEWPDVASRVAKGNTLLCAEGENRDAEFDKMYHHLSKVTLLMSGRHLQHGDENQPNRTMEVFTNCSSSSSSFLLFYLLMSGSGVGRCYDDDLMLVNFDDAPSVLCVLDESHPDFDYNHHHSLRDAKYRYGHSDNVIWFDVPDSREGWAKSVEFWETLAYQKVHKDKILILNFTPVRCKGTPIHGMQDRPASGPVPLMYAFNKAASIKGAGMAPWFQAMWVDHCFAECVLVGGARRAARMSVKFWRDRTIVDFINVKRPTEYQGKTPEEVVHIRKSQKPLSFLWSSNNSILVDQEFWNLLDLTPGDEGYESEDAQHARAVFKAASEAAYYDGTGEPGFINVDKLVQNREGFEEVLKGDYVGSPKYSVEPSTSDYLKHMAKATSDKTYYTIVNPCVTDDTWIMTSEGPRQVKDLIHRPFKAIVNGQAYNATGFWKTGTKIVYNVTTDRGYSLHVTGNHKLLVERDGPQKYDGSYTREQAWVEAHDLVPGDSLVLNNHQNVQWDGEGTFDHGRLLGEMVANGDYSTPCSDLNKLPEGFIADVKELLPRIEKTSSDFHRGFLRSLFDANGSIFADEEKGQSIRLGQSVLSRLHVVQRMLARLGIVSTIHENGPEAVHELVVANDNMVRFEERIGFTDCRNTENLHKCLETLTQDLHEDSFTAKVKSVEIESVEDVFDCTVETVSRFDANGLTAHNCSEIAFILLGAFCVIADNVPFFGDTLDEIEDSFRTSTRALIRTNTMPSVYQKEVRRTNRIGVAITGIHEFAWKFFGYNFYDLIDEEKSKDFWMTMSRFARAVEDEAREYCKVHNLPFPHTLRTIKPSGTVSKLWGLTEGWHLPSMAWYLRWVQFSDNDPLVETYAKAGYPTRKLTSYKNTVIVGFPTKLAICDLMPPDKIVFAGQATPEEQYQWLKLGEKYWIECVEEDGTPRPSRGNQISYTLKYDPQKVSYEEFTKTLREQQSKVRCCSVMPQEDSTAYEYQPEEPIDKETYDSIVAHIELQKRLAEIDDQDLVEDIGKEHIDCPSGACPVDFKKSK